MNPVAYCKPNEANAKRAQATSRPACRVDNYGLARKNTLLAITERINRQCYDLYKVDRTEWLVNENESIGVQEKHKQELGIITQEFFKPSFKGAPEPLLDGPVVRKAVNISNGHVCCDAKLCNEKPKYSGAYKMNSLKNLLNNENVQLIDSKELQNRFKTAGSRITTRKYKVDKAKERTKTPNETRKKTPQEVLRACNRPKSQGKVKPPKMPWRENKIVNPEMEQSSKPKAIKYKQTDTLLPINEDVRKFYERNKWVEPKRRLPVESKKNQQNRNCENCLQKKVPTSELNNKKEMPQWKLSQELKAKVKLNDSNRKKSEISRKKWKNAINIKLDKMNKKLPVGNTKRKSSSYSNSNSSRSQSSSDPDKTPRPNYSSDPDKTPRPQTAILESPSKPDNKRKPLTSSENRDLKETIFQNNKVESREQHNSKQIQKAIAQLENLGLFLDKIEKEVNPEDVFNEQAEVLNRKNIGIVKQKERVEKETRTQVRDASKKDLMVNKKIVKGTKKQEKDPRSEIKEIKQKLLIEAKIKQKDKIEKATKEKEKLEERKVLRQNEQKVKTEKESKPHELIFRRKIPKNNTNVLVENKLIVIEKKDKIKKQIKEQAKDYRRVFVNIGHQAEHEAADANKENIKTEGKDCVENKPKEHLEDLIRKILSSKRKRNREEVDFDFENLNLEQLKRLIIKLKNIHIMKKQISMGGIKTKSLKRLKKRSRKKLSEYREESKELNIRKECLSGKFDKTENLKPFTYNVEKKKTAVVEGLRPMRPLFSNKEMNARRAELAREVPENLRLFCQTYIEQTIEHKLGTLAEADSSSSIVVRNLQIANEVQFAKIQPYPKLGIRREYDLRIISTELDCVLSLEAPNLGYERYSLCDTIQRFLFCLYFVLLIFILFIVFFEMNPIYWRWLLRRFKYFYFDKKLILQKKLNF